MSERPNARIWMIGVDGERPTLHVSKALARDAAHKLIEEWLADEEETTQVTFYIEQAEVEGATASSLRVVSSQPLSSRSES